MLIYTLVIAVGLGSLLLYTSAFFLPKLHRRDDFFWSAVGLFYALDLWVCRENIKGGVLLGQVAVCALLFSLGWQMWRLRVLTPDREEFSLLQWVQESLFPKKQPLSTPSGETSVTKGEETGVTPVVEEVGETVSSGEGEETEVTPVVEEVGGIVSSGEGEETEVTPVVEEVGGIVSSGEGGETEEKTKPSPKREKAETTPDKLSTKTKNIFSFLGGIFKKNKTEQTPPQEKKVSKKRSIVEELDASWEEEEIAVTPEEVVTTVTETVTPEEVVTTVTETITPEEVVTTVTETITPEEVVTTVTETVTPEEIVTTVTETVTPEEEEVVTTVTETVTPEEVVTTVTETVTPEEETKPTNSEEQKDAT